MTLDHQPKSSVLQVHPADNVLVALRPLAAHETLWHANEAFTLVEPIAAKHKFFTRDMAAGEAVMMYGVLVSRTTKAVAKGSLMTTDNVHHAAEDYEYRGVHKSWTPPDVHHLQHLQFQGYHRSDGRVGTANYWLFIPTVFCENRNLDVIREALHNELGYAVTGKYKQFARQLAQAYVEDSLEEALGASLALPTLPAQRRIFPNVDGIKFLNHQGGCGGTRQDAATLSKLLAAYADHPNVGGITVLSLGCQHLQMQQLVQDIQERHPGFDKPLILLEQQQAQSEEALIKTAIERTFLGLVELNKMQRQPAALAKLCVGVKCGGSDGFSGISANPAVGHCADLLVALGGQVLLAEFPELCGVEQELVDRCSSEEGARKFIRLMRQLEAQALAAGSGFHMNPSPGNIKDGLVTDAIKSAGAAKKGGTAPVADVLDYTERATKPGLSLVCTPGNDVEATTGKAAAGATLILFTTGLGTPTGNPVCPTIKVATNTDLARRMADIIDLDTGPIISGEQSIAQMGEAILHHCIEVASGRSLPKAVRLNQDDFIPWKRGVSL